MVHKQQNNTTRLNIDGGFKAQVVYKLPGELKTQEYKSRSTKKIRGWRAGRRAKKKDYSAHTRKSCGIKFLREGVGMGVRYITLWK